MTAAHCACSLKKTDPDDEPKPHENVICKPFDKNQIVSGYNQIEVHGGHMNKDELQKQENDENTFDIYYAYIMDGATDSYEYFAKYDIAMLISDRPLFIKKELKNLSPLSIDRPPIVPICLAGIDSDFTKERIIGVGWGLIYEESYLDSDPTDDLFYSSCMTNEMGPEKWIFEHCDMESIKKNNWSCEKKKYPDKRVEDDQKLCKDVFDEVKRLADESQIKLFDKADKIHIYKTSDIKIDEEPFLTCYNEKLFSTKGWCEVYGVDPALSPKAWGFCSPSCDKILVKVKMKL